MKVTRKTRYVAVVKGQGFGHREFPDVPLVYVARVVVPFEGVDPAAIVGVAGEACGIDGFTHEEEPAGCGFLWSREPPSVKAGEAFRQFATFPPPG